MRHNARAESLSDVDNKFGPDDVKTLLCTLSRSLTLPSAKLSTKSQFPTTTAAPSEAPDAVRVPQIHPPAPTSRSHKSLNPGKIASRRGSVATNGSTTCSPGHFGLNNHPISVQPPLCNLTAETTRRPREGRSRQGLLDTKHDRNSTTSS
jgi:hypothetical protein